MFEPADGDGESIDLTELSGLMTSVGRLHNKFWSAVGGVLLGISALVLAAGIIGESATVAALGGVFCILIVLAIVFGLKAQGTRLAELRLGSTSIALRFTNDREVTLDLSDPMFAATILDFSEDPSSVGVERQLAWFRWRGDKLGTKVTTEIASEIANTARKAGKPVLVRRERIGLKTLHIVVATRIGRPESTPGCGDGVVLQ